MMRRILYIEDDDNHAYVLIRRFRRQGFEVAHACDAESGLAQLERARPDLLILDINLPGADGWSVLRHVRETPQLRDLPVIMCSAQTLETVSPLALERGANAYQPKPLDFPRVFEAVALLLARAQPGAQLP